ncbi:MAG: DNA repair protein RadA, partial [Clostridiales bacterium]|nr:DNA repair protein RadA [Clostridiales bacterium]
MAKKNVTFFCKECGYEAMGWMGKCPSCGMFNTFVEAPAEESKKAAKTDSPALSANSYSWTEYPVTVRLADAGTENYTRISSGIGSLDSLFGGGITEGSVTLVCGEPGIGKSTILMQIANSYKGTGEVLYVSGEESPAQIGMRAERLGIKRNILICSETRFEKVAEQIKNNKPCLCIIDSIQTLYSEQVAGTPGGVAQTREVTAGLIRIAKTNGITIIMVGHIAKDGSIAGPKTIEHMVDTVLGFEGDATGGYRIIRSAKNRFGRSNEICFFEMGEAGLIPVDSSKALLVAGRPL